MAVVFPTAYFGSIAYFQQVLQHESVTVEVWDTFPKQTFRNRCVILGAQGPLRLTLPVEKPNGSKTLTNDVLVVESDDWRNNHWRAIKSAYAAAPYFDHYSREIEALIFTRERNLATYNRLITETIAGLFDHSITMECTTDYLTTSDNTPDFRTVDFESTDISGFISIPYTQVSFQESNFHKNPSILDLLFCDGPMGRLKLT
ncbi:MAG: WbqC family protein [Fluviicola sp.]|nr:WbqC family protein [Fluviicola sp.]